VRDTAGREPHPVRCLRAAVTEAAAWGAQALVVKGDITRRSGADEFDLAGRLLAAPGLPVHAVFGNHDVRRRGADGAAILGAHGIRVATQPSAVDWPGLRLVLAQTAVTGVGTGVVDAAQRQALARLVAEAAGPAFVAMHHYPQRFPIPHFLPIGIPRTQSAALLDALAGANTDTVVASGHSHRHRRSRHGPIVVAEIGSTKDYPGAWAGYAVHEGGIRQVVRRVAAPDAMAWTERTRRAAFGAWGLWSPGLRTHRCFVHLWP
jgi:predicted phosphodiesterase